MSMIFVVDRNDQVIGSKKRENLASSDIYRISALWITNSKGEILMAQRAFTKKKSPGKWGPAVAGTVEEGEDYDQNIVKEIKEELGVSISLDQLHRGEKILVKGETNEYFAQWYTIVLDMSVEDFSIQKEEVERIDWFDPKELRTNIEDHPEEFTSASKHWLTFFLKKL